MFQQHYFRFFSIAILLLLSNYTLIAQSNILQTKVNLTLQETDFTTALAQIEQQTNLTFAYSNSIIPTQQYTLQQANISVQKTLNFLLKNTKLKYEIFDNQILIVKKQYYEIYGILKDETTNEALTAATIYVKNQKIGRTTNQYGYYSLKLLEGQHTLVFSYLGMQSQTQIITLNKRKRVNIALKYYDIEFEEIIVNPTLNEEVVANAPLDQKTMMTLSNMTPSIGGEPDLLHIIRAKAGVQSSAGGVGGLYVRGGNSGHNLVLLDGVPVYNWMHLLGMNSIFNPESVRGVQFYTSGFSAQYGGRLASVTDIQSKEGNPEKWSGMASVNQRSFHGHFSGPLGKKNGAFWIGGRQSHEVPYVRNILQDAFFPNGQSLIDPQYYDINVKVNKQTGLNNRIYLSYYQGRDEISADNSEEVEQGGEVLESNLSYGNTIFSLRWNHIYGKHLFSNLTLNSSTFFNQFSELTYINNENNIENDSSFVYSDIRSDNRQISLKMDFDWVQNKHHIKFGAAVYGYNFMPFYAVYDEESELLPEFETLDIDSFNNQINVGLGLNALHSAFYVEDDITLTDLIKLRLGIRFSTFKLDSDAYFEHFEPRLLLTANLSEKSWVAFSVTKMVQYLHLISNADIGLPQDLWLPSTSDFEPAVSWQYSLDGQYNIKDNWRIKGALFYKTMNNLVAQPDTITRVDFGNEVTDQLLIGDGLSYGGELSAFFKKDKWTGFAAYTLSWANRNYENVNTGQTFAFQFDTRHYLQLLLNYKINDHFQVGLRGHLSSPRPKLVSLLGSLESGLELVDINPLGQRNKQRGRLEHRIDLSLNYHFKTPKIEHQVRLELYNAYNQKNPIFYYLDDVQAPNQYGLFVPMMLSGSYSLRF